MYVALSVSTAIITVFVKLLEIFRRRKSNVCNVTVRGVAAGCGPAPAARRAYSSRWLMNGTFHIMAHFAPICLALLERIPPANPQSR